MSRRPYDVHEQAFQARKGFGIAFPTCTHCRYQDRDSDGLMRCFHPDLRDWVPRGMVVFGDTKCTSFVMVNLFGALS